MKLVVFGATGSVGVHVVQQALQRGHEVAAFTRNPARMQQQHVRLQTIHGDVTDPAAVRRAVAGHDAVIVALGAGSKGGLRAPGTRMIIEAMEQTGVRRLICQSTLGVGDSSANLNFLWKHVMFGLLLRPAYNDHVRQEEYVRHSDLDWTIVRPSAFTDGPHTGQYERGFDSERKGMLKISRADVADFILEQLGDDTYLRQTPAVSY